MKILFTHSYFLRRDKKQLKAGSPYPPLAPLYAAALLRQHGFVVKLADLQFAVPEDIEYHLQTFKPDVFVIYDDSFNYLSKMCLTNMREAAFEMQRRARAHKLPVVVSSSDASDHARSYLDNGADFIILGEAEHSLLELLRVLSGQNKAGPGSVNGLLYYENGNLKKTPARAVIRDLDTLPAPAWDLVNIEPYRTTWLRNHGFFSINFVTTRGCPYKCNWCAKPVYGNRYNSHSARTTARRIADLQQQFGFSHVWFADDIFGLKPGWLKEFSEELKRLGVKISYKIQSRADLLLQDENISYLAASGCREVWMGAESGSQEVLDAMDKGTTISQIAEATALLKKHGIKPCFFLQFGYPGEHLPDISKTISLVNELKPYDIGISVSYPLPGTRFYEKVKADLEYKQNWTDSDDLHLMFSSSYPPGFYRYLQRYVHYHFRGRQASELLGKSILNRRSLLMPYYYFRKKVCRRKLITIEPHAQQYL